MAGLNFGFKLAGVMVMTALLVWLGLISAPGAGQVPTIWWADAALASVMLLDQRPRWVPLLAAGFVGNVAGHLLFHYPLWETLALSACDMGGTAIAVYGVGLGIEKRVDLTRQRQFLLFIDFAVLLGPLLASVTAGMLLHLVAGSPLIDPLHRFPASAMGMSLVVPLVLSLACRETRDLFRSDRLGNTLLYLLMIASAATVVFAKADFPLPLLIIPPLLLVAARLGPSGGAVGCCVVGVFGFFFIFSPHSSPWAHIANLSVGHRIAVLQFFVAIAVLSVGVVGILFADMSRANAASEESEERYRALAMSMDALATDDPLTGIANRRQFDRTILREWQRAMRNGSPISLILLEVDRFKSFNDLYGQMEGDNCLRTIASVAMENSRRSSDTAARFGGDEFAIIMPETSADGALAIAERLRAGVLQRAIPHAGNTPPVVSISVGCITKIPPKYGNATEFIAAADAALYGAKQGGRNRVEVSTV